MVLGNIAEVTFGVGVNLWGSGFGCDVFCVEGFGERILMVWVWYHTGCDDVAVFRC